MIYSVSPSKIVKVTDCSWQESVYASLTADPVIM